MSLRTAVIVTSDTSSPHDKEEEEGRRGEHRKKT